MAGKNLDKIIAIKCSFRTSKHHASGLAVLLINTVGAVLQKHFSVIASGFEIVKTPLKKTLKEFLKEIRLAHEQYEVQEEQHLEFAKQLPGAFTRDVVESIINQITSGDSVGAEDNIRLAFKGAMKIDSLELKSEVESISPALLQEIIFDDDIEKMTFVNKVNITKRYVANKTSIAERIVKENLSDMAVIMFKTSFENKLFVAGVIFFSVFIKDFYKIVVSASTENIYADITSKMSLVDFFKKLETTHSSQKLNREVIAKINSKFNSMNKGHLADIFHSTKEQQVKDLITQAMMDVEPGKSQVEVSADMMRSIKVELILHLESDKKSDQDDEMPQEEVPGARVIEVKLALAPTKGVRLSTLNKGDQVQILLDKDNPFANRIINSLKLMDNERVKPLGVKVHSLNFSQQDGLILYVEISKGLIGKAIEESDVKVKSGNPVVAEEKESSGMSLWIGIIAGIIVLIVLVFVIFSNN